MTKIEAMSVIEDPNFLRLEMQSVVQGFRTLWERPNLIMRAGTPEASKLSAVLQIKKNRKEPWLKENFEQICEIVFAGVGTPSLQELREAIGGYMGGKRIGKEVSKGIGDIKDFLFPLMVGIDMYIAGRVVKAETEAWKRLSR